MIGEYRVSTKYGCSGFAAMVSDLIFPEDMEMREVTDLSKVRPGDIVFNVGRSGTVGHVWVALGESWYADDAGYWQVSGRGEGNFGDQVSWGWETNGLIMQEGDGPDGFGYNVIYTRYPD